MAIIVRRSSRKPNTTGGGRRTVFSINWMPQGITQVSKEHWRSLFVVEFGYHRCILIILLTSFFCVENSHFFPSNFPAWIGLVLFLEEDHYVAEDFLHLLGLMQKRANELCVKCNILSLGTYLKTFNYYTYAQGSKVPDYILDSSSVFLPIYTVCKWAVSMFSVIFVTFVVMKRMRYVGMSRIDVSTNKIRREDSLKESNRVPLEFNEERRMNGATRVYYLLSLSFIMFVSCLVCSVYFNTLDLSSNVFIFVSCYLHFSCALQSVYYQSNYTHLTTMRL